MFLVQFQSESPCNSYVAFPFNKNKAEKFMCWRRKKYEVTAFETVKSVIWVNTDYESEKMC